MAVLTCHLCEQDAHRPVVASGKTFCCHGCRDLWELLGEEKVVELKHQPGIDWTAASRPPSEPLLRPERAFTDGAMTEDCLTVNFPVGGLWCASCGLLVEHVVNRLPGVADSKVNFTTESLSVQFQPDLITSTEIRDAVHRLGYDVPSDEMVNLAFHAPETGLMRRFLVSAALSVALMMISIPVWFGYLPQLPEGIDLLLSGILWGFTTPIVFWAGWPFIKGAWTSLRHLVGTMDLLISIASLAAYLYSIIVSLLHGTYLYFDTCGFLITFMLLSRLLETGTRKRALEVTRHLSALTTSEAIRFREGWEERVPAEQIRPGDLVVVRPGGRIPVDGVIDDGTSDIDESFLTGESLCAPKHPGDPVYAGSTSYSGRLVIQTTRAQNFSVLAQTLQMVQGTQALGHAYRRVTDGVLRIFIPTILGIALGTFCLWEFVVPMGTTNAILRAIATLVIACPCALSVAAPIASQCAVQVLAGRGVLLRSDEAIERCAEIDTVVFDKTGTLTEGIVNLTGCFPDDPELLQWAASVESASEHPFGRAVVDAARARGLLVTPVSDFVATPGEGVSGIVDGHRVRVVRHTTSALPMELEQAVSDRTVLGQSLSVLWVDGRERAVLSFKDTIRQEARDTIRSLQTAGIEVHLTSGDGTYPAGKTASALGIGTWFGGLTPTDKCEYIRRLQSDGKKVAYVGDGINDAAALIQSHLGIAMGSGTDVAILAGHLVLMESQLNVIPIVLRVGRRAVSIIRQNLTWAILYNACAVSAAIVGVAGPAVAAAAMVLSSLFVLLNAMRLLDKRSGFYTKNFGAIIGSAALLFVMVRFGI